MEQVPGAELRAFWVKYLSENGPASCDDILAALRRQGLTPRGEDRKKWIRNIHSAATNDPRIAKESPGVFRLAGKRR